MNEKHFADKPAPAVHDCSEHKCPNCFQYRGCLYDLNPAQPLPPFENNKHEALILPEQNNHLYKAA